MAITYTTTTGSWGSKIANWQIGTSSSSYLNSSNINNNYSLKIGDKIGYLMLDFYQSSDYTLRGIAFSMKIGNDTSSLSLLNNATTGDIEHGCWGGNYSSGHYLLEKGHSYFYSTYSTTSSKFSLNLSGSKEITASMCNLNSDGTYYITIVITGVSWHTADGGNDFTTTINIPVDSVTINSFTYNRSTKADTTNADQIILNYSFAYPTSFTEYGKYYYKITGQSTGTSLNSRTLLIASTSGTKTSSGNMTIYSYSVTLPASDSDNKTIDSNTQYSYTLTVYRTDDGSNYSTITSKNIKIAPIKPVVHMAGRSSGGIAFGQKVSLADPALECAYPAYFYGTSYFPGGITGVTNYSTEEVDTGGTWIGGEKIYVKTGTYESVSGDDYVEVMTLNNFKTIIDIRGMMTTGSPVYQALPYVVQKEEKTVRTYVNSSGNVIVQNFNSDAMGAGHVTVWYTKT